MLANRVASSKATRKVEKVFVVIIDSKYHLKGDLDLSKLDDEELARFKRLMAKAKPIEE